MTTCSLPVSSVTHWTSRQRLPLSENQLATPLAELKFAIANQREQVLVLVGAGVSCATDDNPCARWVGLLEHGLEYLRARRLKDDGWFSKTIPLLASPTAQDLVQAATRIEKGLRESHPGEIGKWLSEAIGGLTLKDRVVIDALLSWGTRLATTNYDNLLEDASGTPPVIWSQGGIAHQVLSGERRGILHLHGHYLSPDSIVFGAESYEDISRNEAIQNQLRSIFTRDRVVFVGWGSGIDDPNFGNLLHFLRRALRETFPRHFVLVRDSEMDLFKETFAGLPITRVSYGNDYRDLGPFLNLMVDSVASATSPKADDTVLRATLVDFDVQQQMLAEQSELSATEYVRATFQLAHALWAAGGRRTAAVRMATAIRKRCAEIAETDRIEFTLEAVECLLVAGYEYRASWLLETVEALISTFASPAADFALSATAWPLPHCKRRDRQATGGQ